MKIRTRYTTEGAIVKTMAQHMLKGVKSDGDPRCDAIAAAMVTGAAFLAASVTEHLKNNPSETIDWATLTAGLTIGAVAVTAGGRKELQLQADAELVKGDAGKAAEAADFDAMLREFFPGAEIRVIGENGEVKSLEPKEEPEVSAARKRRNARGNPIH